MVLYPRYKWSYFEKNWTGSMTQYVTTSKIAFKKLWEDKYKSVVLSRSMQSPEPPSLLEKDLLKSILDVVAPIPKPRSNVVSGRRDQLFWYLQEQPVDHLSTMEYQKSREAEWPQLAQMAFDFLAIPAMSSECERVFSSCAKQTTPESAQLSGDMLWHQECLKNWANRGAIVIVGAFGAILLNL